jgi:hypothetical protein
MVAKGAANAATVRTSCADCDQEYSLDKVVNRWPVITERVGSSVHRRARAHDAVTRAYSAVLWQVAEAVRIQRGESQEAPAGDQEPDSAS